MAVNLVSDVFEAVAERIKSQCDSHSLRDFLSKRYPSGVPKNAGFVCWFREEVKEAIGDLFEGLYYRGPKLRLSDGDSTVMLDLKAAADLNYSDKNSSPREGVKKYCDNRDYPTFAGCLFLGDGSDDSKINKLSAGNIELIAQRKIHDGGRTWIVGLLTSSKR